MIFVYIALVGLGIYLTIRLLAPEWNKPAPAKPRKTQVRAPEPTRTSSRKFVSMAQASQSPEVEAINEYIKGLEAKAVETVRNFEDILNVLDNPEIQESFKAYRKTKDMRILELNEKCRKLERLLDERGKEFKKTETDRVNEVRHREEFQKVRAMLESQLLELKEKNKTLSQENNELKKQNDSLKDQFSTKAIY